MMVSRYNEPFSEWRLQVTRWLVCPLLVLAGHIALVAIFLWQSDSKVTAMSVLPKAAPIVVQMVDTVQTVQNNTIKSVAQQQDNTLEPKETPQPELNAIIKEVKEAKVAVAVTEKPRPEKKEEQPKDHKPKPKKQVKKKPEKHHDQQASPQSEVNNSDAKVTKQNAAPQVGASSQMAMAKMNWQSLILAELQKKKRYPAYAMHQHLQDTVMVHFVIDREGNVLDADIVASQGIDSLDHEALALMKRVSPLPPPPASAFSLGSDRLDLAVPIEFVIK